ncbi:MAG: AbrB/MazE/SpoVT family DNA-binding domain-containing protein [Blastocatellia bacterium]
MLATAAETAIPIEFLSTTYLGEKGQLTIPKQFRDSLTLEAGAPIAVLQIGNGLLLIPEQARFRQLCDSIAEVFARHDVTADDLLATLPETREHVFAELYPELAQQETTRKATRGKRR